MVVESKLISDLKQSASGNDIWFLYHRHKQNHYHDNWASKLQREYTFIPFSTRFWVISKSPLAVDKTNCSTCVSVHEIEIVYYYVPQIEIIILINTSLTPCLTVWLPKPFTIALSRYEACVKFTLLAVAVVTLRFTESFRITNALVYILLSICIVCCCMYAFMCAMNSTYLD